MAKKVGVILSHWYHHIENLQDSPQRFYANFEEAIKTRELPDLKLSRTFYREGGLTSAKREYLRVTRRELIFDICAAPFGKGFFISWWLGEPLGFLQSFPILGALFRPVTYFRHDTALMFQESVHAAVLEVLGATTQSKGLRALTELEKKPILSSFFKR